MEGIHYDTPGTRHVEHTWYLRATKGNTHAGSRAPQAGTSAADYLKSGAVRSDGSIFVAGITTGDWDGEGHSLPDMAGVALDANGSELWRWMVSTPCVRHSMGYSLVALPHISNFAIRHCEADSVSHVVAWVAIDVAVARSVNDCAFRLLPATVFQIVEKRIVNPFN